LLFCTKLVYCCAIETLVFIMLWVRWKMALYSPSIPYK
jgi:hypothetical protein